MLNIQPSNTPVQAVAIVGNTIHYRLTEDDAQGYVSFIDDTICNQVVKGLIELAKERGKVISESDLIERIFEIDNFNLTNFHFTGLTASL